MDNDQKFTTPEEIRRLARMHLRALAASPLVEASEGLDKLLDNQREQVQNLQDSPIDEKKIGSNARSILNTQRQIERQLNRAILFSNLTQLPTEGPADLWELAKRHDSLFNAIFPPEIAFTFNVASDLEPADIPESVLVHTLVCLCINAREALSENGMVSIQVEQSNAPLLVQPGSSDSDFTPPKPPYILIRISDTGEGVNPDIRNRLFEPFVTSKDDPGHSGLSLFLCRRLLAMHGAMIDYSAETEGSTFELTLPMLKPQPVAGTATAPPPVPKSTHPTVLIVEDEQALRRLLVKQVHNMNLHVLEAENGSEALQKVGEQQPNIILVVTDIMMPEMGGIELVDTLRSSDPELPAIFISGYIDSAGKDADERHKFSRYIRKPFPLRILSEKIRELLPDV